MRRTLFVALMFLVWGLLLLCCWRGLHAVTLPTPPQPSFFSPVAPTAHRDQKFDIVTLTEQEALLAWSDDFGVHQVKLSRRDFDLMFGVIRVEPLTPEEQHP